MRRFLLTATLLLVLQSAPVFAQDVAQTAPAPEVITEAEQRARQYARDTFDKYDLDNDGVISQREFFADVTKAFVEKDTNRDGVISFEESNVRPQSQTDKLKDKMMEKKNNLQKKLGEKLIESTK